MYAGSNQQKQRSVFHNVDWLTIFLYVCLVMIGWVNIYAAVYDIEHQSIFDLSRNYGKQLLWILSSFILITAIRSEEHTSELQSLMRISYAVFCLKKKKTNTRKNKKNIAPHKYITI